MTRRVTRRWKSNLHSALSILFGAWFCSPSLAISNGRVTIEWQSTANIFEYELKISQNEKLVLGIHLPKESTHWTGELPFGHYSYQLRIKVDAKGRQTSPWSEPIPFAVLPSPPTLLSPPNESAITAGHPSTLTLSWTPVSGVRRFQVEVWKAGRLLGSKITDKTRISVHNASPGDYSWAVTPLLEASEAGESAASPNILTDRRSDVWKFRVDSPREVAAAAAPAPPSAELESSLKKVRNYDAQLGLQFGPGYYLPTVSVQRLFSPSLAFGLRASYANQVAQGLSVSLWGVALLVSYRFHIAHIAGFFAEGTAGVLTFNAASPTASESAHYSPSVSLTSGWQWMLDNGLNFSLSAGGMYVSPHVSNIATTQIQGLLPVVQASVGYAF